MKSKKDSTATTPRPAPSQSKPASSAGSDAGEAGRQVLWTCLVLAVLTFAVFWPVIRCEFITYDDPDFVTNNRAILQGLSWGTIGWAFSSLHDYWQPLTNLSYLFDYTCFGLSARAFHFTNLWLHVANTVLLFLVLQRMTRAHWPSALAAALFALHPLHVETVAWVSERKGVLSTTFWMLTMLAYAHYAQKPNLARYLLTLAALALGFLSKSMLVTLPCVLLLLDFWPLGRIRLGGKGSDTQPDLFLLPQAPWARVILEKIPFFVLAGFSSWVTIVAQRKIGTSWTLEQLPLPRRMVQVVMNYVEYLRKMVWPDDLAVFYPYPTAWPWWAVLLGTLALGAITIFFWMRRGRQPWALVGWLWYLGTLFPVAGLFQTGQQAMADRYTYVPLTGIFIVLAWGGVALWKTYRWPEWGWKAVAFGMIFLCIASTRYQLPHWQSSRALFEHTARVAGPNSLAEAVLGNLLTIEGKHAEAMEHLQRSLALQPRAPETLLAMGNCCFEQRQFEKASEYYQKVIAATPESMVAHFHLALSYQALGKADEAIAHYRTALKLDPSVARGYFMLGSLLQAQHKLDEALVNFKEAVRLQPNWPEALSGLAWILVIHPDAKIRDGNTALRLATQACELSGSRNTSALNSLAAAYAETGQYPKAVQTMQSIIELAKAGGQPPQVIEYFQKLQKLYQENRSCRELKEE